MAQTPEKIEVTVEEQGWVVIPAELCKAIGGVPGESITIQVKDGRIVVTARKQKLFVDVEDEKLVLEQRDNVLAKLRARFSQVPAEVSLSDELIQERKAEAREENELEQVK